MVPQRTLRLSQAGGAIWRHAGTALAEIVVCIVGLSVGLRVEV